MIGALRVNVIFKTFYLKLNGLDTLESFYAIVYKGHIATDKRGYPHNIFLNSQ